MSDTHATNNETDFEIDLGPADAPAPSDDFEVDLSFGAELDEPDDGVSIDLSEPEPEPEPEEEADADDEAVLAELRETLRTQIGDWYVIHTYSGMENRVKQNLDSRVKTLGNDCGSATLYSRPPPPSAIIRSRPSSIPAPSPTADAVIPSAAIACTRS